MSDYRDWDYQDMRDAEIEGWRQRLAAAIEATLREKNTPQQSKGDA